MQLFLKANKVAEDDQVPIFLTVIGGKAYAVLRDLVAPDLPQDKDYDALVGVLKNHYELWSLPRYFIPIEGVKARRNLWYSS